MPGNSQPQRKASLRLNSYLGVSHSTLSREVRHRSTLMTGVLLAPQAVGSPLPRVFTGKLVGRIGPRPVILAGLAITVLDVPVCACDCKHERVAAGSGVVCARALPGPWPHARQRCGHGRNV